GLIEKHRKTVMIGMCVVVIPPFAFFGIDSYFQGSSGGGSVATVGDYRISQAEFTQALQERQDMLRNVSGGRLDPALLDSQELRLSVLDNLVQQQLLMQRAVRSGLAVSDRQ